MIHCQLYLTNSQTRMSHYIEGTSLQQTVWHDTLSVISDKQPNQNVTLYCRHLSTANSVTWYTVSYIWQTAKPECHTILKAPVYSKQCDMIHCQLYLTNSQTRMSHSIEGTCLQQTVWHDTLSVISDKQPNQDVTLYWRHLSTTNNLQERAVVLSCKSVIPKADILSSELCALCS